MNTVAFRALTALLVIGSATADQVLIEENTFDRGFGNWQVKSFTWHDLGGTPIGGGRATIAGGWARVFGYADFDCYTMGNVDGWKLFDSDGYRFYSAGGGIFFPAPDGDYTVETAYRQQTWRRREMSCYPQPSCPDSAPQTLLPPYPSPCPGVGRYGGYHMDMAYHFPDLR